MFLTMYSLGIPQSCERGRILCLGGLRTSRAWHSPMDYHWGKASRMGKWKWRMMGDSKDVSKKGSSGQNGGRGMFDDSNDQGSRTSRGKSTKGTTSDKSRVMEAAGSLPDSQRRPRKSRKRVIRDLVDIAEAKLKFAQMEKEQMRTSEDMKREKQALAEKNGKAQKDATGETLRTDSELSLSPNGIQEQGAKPLTTNVNGDNVKGHKVQPLHSSDPRQDSFYDYMNEIRRVDLIKHEDEIELARGIQSLMAIDRKHRELERSLGRPPSHQEWADALGYGSVMELQTAIIRGHRARDQMVTANLRLVNSVVNQFIRRNSTTGITPNDLMQEGSIGLIRAAERFDGSKGYRFSTFASWWIRATITRTVQESTQLIRLPSRVTEMHQKIRKAQRTMIQRLGRDPTDSEVAKEIGTTSDKVRFVLSQVNKRIISLDKPTSPSRDAAEDLSLLNSIPAPNPDSTYVDSFMRQEFLGVLRTVLSEKEIFVLTMRFGLGGGEPKTLVECGDALRLSPERIRQICFQALNKLRESKSTERLRTEYAEEMYI